MTSFRQKPLPKCGMQQLLKRYKVAKQILQTLRQK